MRILMVSPYPPARDGLANYAVQEVKRLRAQGHDVEVLSPGPSAAHHHLDLVGVRGGLALARRVRAYDRVIVQYHPAIFMPPGASPGERALVYAVLAAAWTVARATWSSGSTSSRTRAPRRAPRRWPHAACGRRPRPSRCTPSRSATSWRGPSASRRPRSRSRTTASTSSGARRSSGPRRAAGSGCPRTGSCSCRSASCNRTRASTVPVRAFSGLAEHGCRLEIVGSLPRRGLRLRRVRRRAPRPGRGDAGGDAARRVRERRRVRRVDRGAPMRWCLPYRLIWSSGVCERAALYHRPVIASRIGRTRRPGHGRRRARRRRRPARRRDALDGGTGAGAGGTGKLAHGGPRRGDDRDPDACRPPPTDRNPRFAVGEQVGRRLPLTTRTAPLRRLTPLSMPQARSARPGASSLKRVVRRLTAWQVDPIIGQVNRLQQATIDALAAESVPPTEPDPGSTTAQAGAVGVDR